MATIDQYKIKIDVDGENQVKSLTKSLSGLGTTLAGIGFGAFIANAFRMADAMNDIADATGLTAGYVKGLGNAIQQAGGDMNDVGTIVNKFYQNIDDLANGSDKAIDAFAKLNIEQEDLLKTSRQDILGLTLKRLSEMGPSAERTALGIEIFGKAFGKIDPKKLDEILKTQDFAKLDIEIRKAGEAYGAMEANILALQQAVLAVITPFVGEMENMRLSAEQAEKVVKTLGIVLGIAFGAKTLVNIIEITKAIRQMAIVSNLLSKNPVLKLLAGGALAVGVGAAIDKLMEAQDISLPEVGGGSSAAADQTAAASTIEASQREKAAKAAARTTQEVVKQNEIANRLQRTITSTIGMEENRAEIIRAMATIEADYANKRLQLEGQIKTELAKGKDTNQGIVVELQNQLAELNKQEVVVKNLTTETIKREQAQKALTASIEKSATIEEFNLQARLDAQKSLLMLQAANGEITDRQAKIGTQLAQAQAKFEAERIKLLERRAKIQGKASAQELADLDDAESRNATRYANEIRDIADVEAAETLRNENYAKGMTDALAQITATMTPYKQAQDAIAATWGRLSSAVDTFVETGKFKFKDFAKSVIEDIAKIIIKAQLLKAIQATLGAFGLSIPGFAEGGNVKGNKPILVGEKGPELFVPPSAGKIVPNNQLGQGKGMATGAVSAPITNNYITNNISAVDAKSVAQLFAENRKTLLGSVKMAEKELPYMA